MYIKICCHTVKKNKKERKLAIYYISASIFNDKKKSRREFHDWIEIFFSNIINRQTKKKDEM